MMGSLNELSESLATIGLRSTLAVIIGRIADRLFDTYHGLETVDREDLRQLDISSPSLAQATRYQPTGLLTFRALLRQLELPRESVFLDIGSGKGRVLILAARHGFAQVRGIEFSPRLCAIARRNVAAHARKSGHSAPIEIIEGDVLDYRFRDDEDIFYFFDVFDDAIMSTVIARISDSLERRPRPAWIIYLHPRLGHLLDQQPRFQPILKRVIWGYAWNVYRTTA